MAGARDSAAEKLARLDCASISISSRYATLHVISPHTYRKTLHTNLISLSSFLFALINIYLHILSLIPIFSLFFLCGIGFCFTHVCVSLFRMFLRPSWMSQACVVSRKLRSKIALLGSVQFSSSTADAPFPFDRADFMDATRADAKETGLGVEAYLSRASIDRERFLSKDEMHNRDEIREELLNVFKDKGQFPCFWAARAWASRCCCVSSPKWTFWA